VKKAIILSALIGSFALIFTFVWMNRYVYEQKDLQILRINRFTSQLCYSQRDGTWNSHMVRPEPTGSFFDRAQKGTPGIRADS
jgi:hypothetical protein